MRRLDFKRSFVHGYKALNLDDQIKTDRAIRFLVASLESGELRHGLGVKKLRNDIWKIRVDIRIRLCFQLKKDAIELILLGSHEDVRDFLKNI